MGTHLSIKELGYLPNFTFMSADVVTIGQESGIHGCQLERTADTLYFPTNNF